MYFKLLLISLITVSYCTDLHTLAYTEHQNKSVHTVQVNNSINHNNALTVDAQLHKTLHDLL